MNQKMNFIMQTANAIARFLGLIALVYAATIAVSGIQTGYTLMPPLVGTAYELAVAVVALFLYRRYLGGVIQVVRGRTRNTITLIASGALLADAIAGARRYWVKPPPSSLEQAANASSWATISLLIAVLIVAPLLEEALYRSFLLTRLRARMNTGAAILISAALFALAHEDAPRMLGQLASGLVFGVIAIRTGRLWLAAIAHGCTNLGGVLFGLAEFVHLPERLHLLYPAACVLAAVAAGFVFVRTLHRTDA